MVAEISATSVRRRAAAAGSLSLAREDTPLTAPAAEAYCVRFRKVLEHIDRHLDDDLNVDRLSGVAAFSKYHFHRQFSALYGIGVFRYVQLVRLRRASYLLAFRDRDRIIDIALASGYESHEAFSRAFKKAVGQTPSEFRERPRWDPWHTLFRQLSELRSRHMKPDNRSESVKVVDFAETRVAAYEHRGDPKLIGNSVRRFIEWRKQTGQTPRVSATFNVWYDDPVETPPEEFRLDLCAATDRDVAENAFGVVEKSIPAGRCAVLRHVGPEDTLGETATYLYATWLPASGEEPRDFPIFFQRIQFYPDVPEHETVTDIFLPLR
jgi:AraC family transcriptional regulator